MKRLTVTLFLLSLSFGLLAQESNQIVKTGYNFGPLPVVAFDADKGLQLGAVVQLFNFGDGSNYPNYNSKLYLEASFFTKGSQLYQLRYDNKTLIPNVRWSSSFRATIDKAYDFYGFNGYESYYDYARIQDGKDGESFIFSPFYRLARNEFMFKSDFLGRITDNLQWEAGIFAYYHKIGSIDYASINKNKKPEEAYPEDMPTLFDIYKQAGVITENEAEGGFSSGLRAGLVYDTRDKEGAPSSGIWAEGHFTAAIPGISKNPYYRYSLTWRHYLPIVKQDKLTFAYRLNYEGTFGDAPFYALPYMTVMGEKQDLEGLGGFNTVRGVMRSRVWGLDAATYNLEFRWRFVKFLVGKQNIALGLNLFSDGTMTTKGKDLSGLKSWVSTPVLGKEKDLPHVTLGAGFRFIMNENFIIAVDYGMPLSHFMKNSPIYNQDGTGAFYVNLGYLF
ncbi:MAG: BamA/TamA family outer membrane protein [Bacteroidales bacterium]|nr:BamA/TamA family outer membrane protein [Candidatus Cacconaster equifaecalis]